MTAFVTFTSSTVVAWLAVLSPFLVLAAVAVAFTVPELLGRRRARRRMDGLFSPGLRTAPRGDAAGSEGFRPLASCGSFAVGGGGLSTRPAAPHSVFAGGVPAPPVLGGPRRMVARADARAGGSDPELASRPGSFADRDGTSTPYEHTETDPRLFPHLEPTSHSPMVQGTRLAARLTLWVAGCLALVALVAGCNPQDDSGTNGVVEPTSEAETDSGSQP